MDYVENGEEAFRKVKTKSYDLVLMDMQMPVMDGYQATRKIREWESERKRGRSVPIFALTAHAMEGEREKTLNAGCTEYLTKPIKKKDLLKAIFSVQGQKRAA